MKYNLYLFLLSVGFFVLLYHIQKKIIAQYLVKLSPCFFQELYSIGSKSPTHVGQTTFHIWNEVGIQIHTFACKSFIETRPQQTRRGRSGNMRPCSYIRPYSTYRFL